MNLAATFSYPAVNLGVYASNQIGKCMLSFFEHDKSLDDANVYIVDTDRSFELNLYDEKLTRLENIPPGEVFLVDFGNDGLHRVVCNDIQSSLFFIDSGEIMQMSSATGLKMFSLSQRAQKMSARGIPCKIIEVLDELDNQINDLTEILYEQIWFTVHHIDEGYLVVTLHKTKPVEAVETKGRGLQLTQEQVDMLYEEPAIVTTNALKAVLHYIPRDDDRICQHYDYRTGRCFKGNSCTLEHVAPLKDGTRDRKGAKHKLLDQSLPMVGATVKVCVTCIVSAAELYVHIPEIAARTMSDSLDRFKQKINAENMVEQYRPFVGLPDLHDLVLVKVKGAFYRGKVIELFEDNTQLAIFFVDYGSVTMVHCKDVFQWHPLWDTTPAQAYRCFLENIQLRKQNDEEATTMLRSLILNGSSVSAEIISCAEDLYVRLFDENGFDIGETLYANGVAHLKQRLVPISTRFPG
ncbi:uncharacterized protein LOC129569919 [Sitodiplosis mosellana]|uniref:uncharacterized protein LOC129569919 n=1 Tax=Sitodiplosis mosellana TaxID=263140 RepID=UPI002443B3DA|nr:uncharacterized protein LOC129569919 [Sitodiplosis mosellana]